MEETEIIEIMNQEDRLLMTQIEKDIAEIKLAIIGSPMSGNRGLVGQVNHLESEFVALKKKVDDRIKEADVRIDALDKSNIKNSVTMRIIIFFASLISVGLVTMLFKYFDK